jgi:hypothetical protein
MPSGTVFTKLNKCLALNTIRTFLEFVTNSIIVDDAIRAHKEGKKRKGMSAPSGRAPPKYRVLYPSHLTNQPHQHQHQ